MSNNAKWKIRYQQKPDVEINPPVVTIDKLRNFRWKSTTEVECQYDRRSYNLDELSGVWFGIDSFGGVFPLAHTFLSFEFNSAEYLCVSIEARLEKNQTYSPLNGLFNQYELMFVLADERDVIGQRVVARDNELYLYPIKSPVDIIRSVLVDMLRRAGKLADEPSTYNTLTNNCTTEILRHVNKFSADRIAYGLPVLFPGLIHRLLHHHNLIKGQESLAKKKERYSVKNIHSSTLHSEAYKLPFRRNH